MASSNGVSLVALTAFLAAVNGASLHSNTRILANPHIVNGVDTPIEKVPYQIIIESYRFPSCGGAIISENWLVTAAHCVVPESGSLWGKRIRAGVTYEFMLSWAGTVHQIEKAKYHPDFSLSNLDYDVAVVRVYEKFEYSPQTQPITIPLSVEEDAFIDYNSKATTSGWGRTSQSNFLHPWHLKSIDIPLIPRQQCINLYGPGERISPRMICGAGNGLGGPCLGDSGGPLVQRGQLIGLVSWGESCNDAKYPSVFTNLFDYEIRSFIKSYSGV